MKAEMKLFREWYLNCYINSVRMVSLSPYEIEPWTFWCRLLMTICITTDLLQTPQLIKLTVYLLLTWLNNGNHGFWFICSKNMVDFRMARTCHYINNKIRLFPITKWQNPHTAALWGNASALLYVHCSPVYKPESINKDHEQWRNVSH